MIGAASMTCRPPPGSASTGQLPVFWHSATAGLAHSGGSVIEMNCPPDTLMITCAATSAVGSASARTAGTGSPEVRFCTRTWRRTARHGPGTGLACTDTAPSRGWRRRTATPAASWPASGSRSSPPGTENSLTQPAPSSSAAPTVNSISRSTASSHVPAAAPGACPAGPSVLRRWTCRNRRMICSSGGPVCSSTHSVWLKLLSDGSAAAYPGAMTTPNCHRLRFLAAEARYGYKM
jgi:hypothetical protein